MLYKPELPPCPTIHNIEEEISYVSAIKNSLDSSYPTYAADNAYYEKTLEGLFALCEQSSQPYNANDAGSNQAEAPSPPSPESPADNSSGSSAFSRKRSLASMRDFDLRDPKRVSLNASPALTPGTPGTPASLSIPDYVTYGTNLGEQANSSHHNGNPYRERENNSVSGRPRAFQGYQSDAASQFHQVPQNTAMPMHPNQTGGISFQQQQVGGTRMPAHDQFGVAGPSNSHHPTNPGSSDNYIDLTSFDDEPHGQNDATVDPFPELASAYQGDDQHLTPANAVNQDLMDEEALARFLGKPTQPGIGHASSGRGYNQYPSPAEAFNQDFMGEEELTQFFINPTQPGRGYAFGGRGLNPLTAANPAQPRFKQDYTSLENGLLDDFDKPHLNSDVNPEALTKLIENIKPHDEIPPEERQQTPQAMSSQLMEHQKLGLTWLMKMEEGSAKGGILADEMGLGKTVQALALILARPSNDPACKTTLIIAPIALMKQWEKELQRHVKASHQLQVYIYHGHGKNADFSKLRKYDVVLTTFGTLGSELRQQEKRKEAELVQRENRDPTYVRKAKDKLALIGAECMWYRVIIDEAQCIKNKSTQVSKASNEIMSRYRLCMTGTPLMNSVDELYPLIRFLRIKPYNDAGRFNYDIAKPFKNSKTDWKQKQVIGRLQALLKSIMLRREKTSLVDGKEICTIPPKVTKIQNVEFNDEERALYKAIETNSQLTFNRYLQKGTVNNNYANVLVLLLRLRQACCHPHLIKDLGVQVSTEGIDEDDLLSRAQRINADVVKRLKEADGFECPICLEVDLNPTIIIPCGHTCCGECFQKLIDPTIAIREGNEDSNGARCPHCRGTLSSNNITDYKHFCKVFCPERLDESDRLEEEEEDHDHPNSDSDSDSDSELNDDDDLDGFVVPDDADDDFETPPVKAKTKDKSNKVKSKKGKGKARAQPKLTLAQLKKESLRNKAAKKKYIRRLRKTYVGSGKIEKTVELLSEIHTNDPTEKTLIFSQFTSLLDLLEVPLSDRGFRYQRYDGSMKMDERAEAVNKFMDESTEKIMLISLKAGNAGLNLNRASQVIILDPFWNPFIEDQAVDRAHRMPQEREVHVHRLLVPETVEDRICALQDKKRELINAALDEKAGKSLSRLSVKNLMFLFGLTRERGD